MSFDTKGNSFVTATTSILYLYPYLPFEYAYVSITGGNSFTLRHSDIISFPFLTIPPSTNFLIDFFLFRKRVWFIYRRRIFEKYSCHVRILAFNENWAVKAHVNFTFTPWNMCLMNKLDIIYHSDMYISVDLSRSSNKEKDKEREREKRSIVNARTWQQKVSWMIFTQSPSTRVFLHVPLLMWPTVMYTHE